MEAKTRKTKISPITSVITRRLGDIGFSSYGFFWATGAPPVFIWFFVSLILGMCILFFVLFAHKFFDGSEFGAHTADAQRDECYIGEQAQPDDSVSRHQVRNSLHKYIILFYSMLARKR